MSLSIGVTSAGEDSYCLLYKFLKSKYANFYTFELKLKKLPKIVFREVPFDQPVKKVTVSLQEKG